MLNPLQHISDMAEIIARHSINNIIISPGSRNAPLINGFTQKFPGTCTSIVDERSAAYYALGKAIASGKPSVIISTSGTATLNFAPAVAEAYHLSVPLIILTADRPPEWIDQQDNQTIRQDGIYARNCKASYQMPAAINSEDELWFAHRLINEACIKAIIEKPGPVHVNIPLGEPLYESLPPVSDNLLFFNHQKMKIEVPDEANVLQSWKRAERIMIICGQFSPDQDLIKELDRLSEDPRVAIITEVQSNIPVSGVVKNIDLLLASTENSEELKPELVIYYGGQIISKHLKAFLRNLNGSKFFFITPDIHPIDSFKNLNQIIQCEPKHFFTQLEKVGVSSFSYKHFWTNRTNSLELKKTALLKKIEFSDLAVYNIVCSSLPKDAVIFAGNSSVIRYLQYFDQQSRKIYSNRGTSGIDGVLSTASGIASELEENVYVILGDLSFIYDSNALWNKNLPSNLKIIVINNRGGGIFHIIDGPANSKAFEDYFEAYHPADISCLAKAFHVGYDKVDNPSNLKNKLNRLIVTDNCFILEVVTPRDKNASVLKSFLVKLKS